MVSFPWRLAPRQYVLIGLWAAFLVGVVVFYRQIDVAALHRRADALNGAVVFFGMVVLPLVGFPVTLVHAVAGLRFGLGAGCALVSLATLLQLLAAYGLVKLAPGFFENKLAPLRKRLPAGTHQSLTLFTMLLPGVPYFAQIYVLPLVGVPLRTFLRWSLPINIARSIVGVTFGDLSDDLTAGRILGFVVYFVVIGVLCGWAFQQLRRRMAEEANANGSPDQASVSASATEGGWQVFLAKRRDELREHFAARRR